MLQDGHGSVRLQFLHGTVRAVPVFGADGSSLERVFLFYYCFKKTPNPPTLAFFLGKSKGNPEKRKEFLFAEP